MAAADEILKGEGIKRRKEISLRVVAEVKNEERSLSEETWRTIGSVTHIGAKSTVNELLREQSEVGRPMASHW